MIHWVFVMDDCLISIHIIYLDIDANEVMRKGYEPWLSRLQQFLEADLEISEHCKFQGTSSHGILFSYDGVEVELLPSPHWGRPGELHTFLQSVQPQKRLRYLGITCVSSEKTVLKNMIVLPI